MLQNGNLCLYEIMFQFSHKSWDNATVQITKYEKCQTDSLVIIIIIVMYLQLCLWTYYIAKYWIPYREYP